MVRNRGLYRLTWALLLSSLTAGNAQELSNIPRQDFWVTDGSVNDIAVTNDRVFIGGSFRYVGPYTGGGVPIDVNTMEPVAKYPKVNGSVHAVEPDGQGGWYIGGAFTIVGGRPRTNLAHITAAGEVDTNWVVHATGGDERGRVEKLLLDGATLYAAGTFTSLNGLPRNYAGAVEATAGVVGSWAPQPDSNVLAIAVSPTAVYLGGKFFSLGGMERRYVGAVDKTTGETTSWNPWNPDINPIPYYNFVTNSYPYALAVINGRVVFPGRFKTGFSWVNLAAFRESDSSWAWGMGGADFVSDLKVRSNILYVAGQFSSIGGDGEAGAVPRRNLAAIDPTSGVTDWNPTVIQAGGVLALAIHEDSVFAVGTFKGSNPGRGYGVRTNADHIVRLDLTSGAVLGPARPFSNGPVIWAVATQGDRVFLGGAFDSVAGVQHEFLAELDGRDGSLQPWNPQPTETVTALSIANGKLLVGGGFRSLDDVPRERLAAYDLATMQLSPWNPQVHQDTSTIPGPAIRELLTQDDAVYIAGEFQGVGEQSRSNLAKVDLTTGLPLAWRADADGPVEAISIAGSYLYVGGEFSRLGGVDQSYLARVNVDTGAVDAWAPEPDLWVSCLSANSTAIYVSGSFTHIAGSPRHGTAAFSLSGGALLPWNLDPFVVQMFAPVGLPLLATDAEVYAVGGFIPGPDYRWLIAVDPTTAALGSWDTRPYTFLSAERLLLDGGRLFVAGAHDPWVGPTRKGLAVYEHEGFSRFTHVERGPSATRLKLTADQGHQVIVERTTDFNTWSGVATNTAWEGILEVEDPTPPANGPTLYRAKTGGPQ